MKSLFILLTIFLLGCSGLQVSSPEEVAEQALLKHDAVMMVYFISSTEKEYIYLAAITDGTIVLFKIEKTPPHKITDTSILFKCVCGNLRENTQWH